MPPHKTVKELIFSLIERHMSSLIPASVWPKRFYMQICFKESPVLTWCHHNIWIAHERPVITVLTHQFCLHLKESQEPHRI